jgi:polysaccharide biosynthesis/export protein VpsN
MHRLVRGALFVLAVTALHTGVAHPQVSDPAGAPLRPGDRVLIKVLLDTTFADTVRIDETGSVVLPRIGVLRIGDLAPSSLADSVRRAYARVVSVPAVEVSPLRRITVRGEVKNPATYYMEPRSTIRDAVAMAGGVTEIGTIGHITVLRDNASKIFEQWERKADATVVIHSGDVLWIDREPWIKRNIFAVISAASVLTGLFATLKR